MVWFRWDGDEIQDMANHFRIYRGFVRQKSIVKDYKLGNTHYQLVRMDAGWATSASTAWSSPLVPFVVTGAILLNVILLACKSTKILNIDMFNYWLILLVGTLIYTDTGSIILGTCGSLLLYLLAFIIGDLTAPAIQESYKIKGVAFIHGVNYT